MIDLPCHILPGLDDGAPDVETSLAMARLAVADGITVTACTPHITPGIYDNRGPAILDAITDLQRALERPEFRLLSRPARISISRLVCRTRCAQAGRLRWAGRGTFCLSRLTMWPHRGSRWSPRV